MTEKRRRTTESIWMDVVRRKKTAKQLRRSAQRSAQSVFPARTSHSNPNIASAVESVPRSKPTSPISRNSIQDRIHDHDSSQGSTLMTKSREQSTTRTGSFIANMDPGHTIGNYSEDDMPGGNCSVPDLESPTVEVEEEMQRGDVVAETETQFQPFHLDEGFPPISPSVQMVSADENAFSTETTPTIAMEGNVTMQTYSSLNIVNQQHLVQETRTELQRGDNGSEVPEVNNKDTDIGLLLQIWKSKLNLNAVVAVVGSVRYTVQQYGFARDNIRDAGANPTWPPYARTQRYFRHIVDTCFPRNELVKLPITKGENTGNFDVEEESDDADDEVPDLEHHQDTQRTNSITLGTENVRIFLPSAWAQLYVATSIVFEQMYPAFGSIHDTSSALEETNLMRNRQFLTTPCNHFFARSGREQVRCGPGNKITVCVENEQPSFQTNFCIQSFVETYHLDGITVATWNVTSANNRNHSVERILRDHDLTLQQRTIVTALSTAITTDLMSDEETIGVLPGDLCTLLRSEQAEEHIFAVIVHRYWRRDKGVPSVAIMWAQANPQENEHVRNAEVDMQYLCSHPVQEVRLIATTNDTNNQMAPDQGPSSNAGGRSFGILSNGIPFVIYRILLYCDGFQKSSAMNPKGSAGGCYFMPMSLPPEARRNTSSVRIISLTPPGVSTNQVLHYIIDDLVNASVNGVTGHTPTGQKVKIFTEVVGFVGDYPASASAVDVVGHVGRSPCTVCSFKRPQQEGSEGSRYGFTTEVHANNSAFMRYGERHFALRQSNISNDDAINLGMVAREKYSDTTCPLMYLQRALESKRSRSAVTVHGVPICCNMFDAFRNNMIAPDHLLTGVAKDVLNAMCRALLTKTLRMKADAFICAALRSNGLPTQKQVFNHRKIKVHSMTLSELFCVLLVSVPALTQVIKDCPPQHVSQDCFRVLSKLQSLIALTYWWPIQELDGKEAVSLIHKDNDVYISELRAMSKKYVKEVHEICKKSEVMRKQLDKPNLHRLIELYEHTLPAFGHVREVMELVFESAHQPLKRCIARSNNHDAHIFAADHCVGNDWQGRTAALLRRLSHPDKATRTVTKRSLRRVLLGPEADLLNEREDQTLIVEIDAILQTLLTPALRKQFEMDNMISNYSVEKRCVWKARLKIEIKELCTLLDITPREGRKLADIAKRWIDTLYPLDQQDSPVILFRKARRTRESETGRQIGTPSGHDTVSGNSCIQIYTEPGKARNMIVTSTTGTTQARPFFFAVLAVFQRSEDAPFALSYKCMKRGRYLQRDSGSGNKDFQLVLLTPDVRRVAIYHDCAEDSVDDVACDWDAKTGQVRHVKSILMK